MSKLAKLTNLIISLILCVELCVAQNPPSTSTQTNRGVFDSVPVVSSLPTACAKGQLRVSGTTLYVCSVGGNPGTWSAVGTTTITFDNVATGTNTTATLTCGTGCTVTTSGSGVVNANQLGGTSIGTPTGTGNVVFSAAPTFSGTTTFVTISGLGTNGNPLLLTTPATATNFSQTNQIQLTGGTNTGTGGQGGDILLRAGSAKGTPGIISLTGGNVDASTADIAGGNVTLIAGPGNGNATGSSLIFQTPTAGGSGTTAQSQATRLTISSAGLVATVPYSGTTLTLAPANNTTGLTVTGGTMTNTSTDVVHITGAVNGLSASANLIFGNLTEPGSGCGLGSCYLIQLQTGGALEFYVDDGGNLTATGAITGATVAGATLNATSAYQINGIAGVLPVLLNNSSAYTAIASTNAETFFGIAADGKLAAGVLNAAKHRIEIELAGVYGTNGVTDTINFKYKLCQVSGCGSGTVVQIATTGVVTPGLGVTNQGWSQRVVCNVFTAGSSGTMDCQGAPGALYFTAVTTVIWDNIVNTATSTVNTTVDEYVSVSVTWNNNSANNTITLRNFAVKGY